MIEKIKFRTVNCKFQHKLSSDIHDSIMRSDKLLVPAGKTSNVYKMDTQSYNDLLQKNITKTYKKVTPDTADSIELKAKDIAKKLRLDRRINTTAKREAFITLKVHKPNFGNNPTCRLTNPAMRLERSANRSLTASTLPLRSFVRSFIRSFVHSFICSFVRSFIHSFI